MFISITNFDSNQTDSSHILITVVDSFGQPEKTIRFDEKTNFEYGKWIQVRFSEIPKMYEFPNLNL